MNLNSEPLYFSGSFGVMELSRRPMLATVGSSQFVNERMERHSEIDFFFFKMLFVREAETWAEGEAGSLQGARRRP